jgi:hypothetical protein
MTSKGCVMAVDMNPAIDAENSGYLQLIYAIIKYKRLFGNVLEYVI